MIEPFRGIAAHAAWQDNAACVGYDPEIWFPDPSKSSMEAKAICADCPVTIKCLADALDYERGRIDGYTHHPHGVRGGLSAYERRELRAPRTCRRCDNALTASSQGRYHYCDECQKIPRHKRRVASDGTNPKNVPRTRQASRPPSKGAGTPLEGLADRKDTTDS